MSDDSRYIQFLAEARSGDRVAMGRLAKLVWERVYPFVFRVTPDHNAAEDILQETLLAMLCRLDSLRDDKRFWPWIHRIAWHKVQDRLRDRRLQSLVLAELARRESAAGAGSVPDPLDTQVREESLQQLAAALDQLSTRHRDILRLRCYEQLAYPEIAARTRTTAARARTHFHRARKSLEKCLVCCV